MALAYYNAPAAGKTFAAYRPIVIEIIDDGVGIPLDVPVMYLDIYIGGVYYKSYSSTSPRTEVIAGSARPIWRFDIQDVLQEYLRSEMPPLALAFLSVDTLAAQPFYVKFRPAYNILGYITPDTPIPVQGNYDAAPVSGGGLQSGNYTAVNTTLQHEDNQDILLHLAAYRAAGTVSTSVAAYPMSHRPTDGALKAGVGQFGFFPIMLPMSSIYGANTSANTVTLYMDWQEVGNPAILFRATDPGALFSVYTAPYVLNVPFGLGNLNLVAWAAGSTVPDLTKIYRYRVYLKEDGLNTIFFISGWVDCTRQCVGSRLHFLNNAGGYDAVNFAERADILQTKSSGYQRGLPAVGLQRRSFGAQRFGVHSNEKVSVVTADYAEQYQKWLAELLDSPRVYSEELSQGDALPDLIPVVVVDGEFTILKQDERFVYEFALAYQPSNDNIRQRG